MTPRKQINSLLTRATRVGLKEVERRARKIMRSHRNIRTFILAMGTASFYDANGPIMEYNKRYLRTFYNFIYEYDEYLKLTGCPMKLNSWNGPKVTDF